MRDCWKLAVRDEFSASHALRHYHGKCENLHGHNFFVEIEVAGWELDAATGMLVDFAILKKILKDILKDFDHCLLNEKPPFDQINPSSENLARIIYEKFEARLAALPEKSNAGLQMLSVTISEKSSQSATYCKGTGIILREKQEN